MGDRTPVSVIIATRERPQSLERLLASLSQCSPAAEQVVVSDQSRHGASEEVALAYRTLFPKLIYLRVFPEGASRARNAGLAHATGGIAAFTDDDCLVPADWVGNLRAAFDQDGELAGLMGRVVPAGESQARRPISVRTATEAKTYCRAREADPAELGWSGNLAVRAAEAHAVGGFDESLGPGTRWPAGEDTDFVYRLVRGGHKVAYLPNVTVCHAHVQEEATYARARAGYRRGQVAFLVKHLLRGDFWFARRLGWIVRGELAAAVGRRGAAGQEGSRGCHLQAAVRLLWVVASRGLYDLGRRLASPHTRPAPVRMWTAGIGEAVSPDRLQMAMEEVR